MNKHVARKRFGQHFLTDETIIVRIISAINPQTEDHIIEIGPGLGVLTLALLEHVPEIEAVELDRDIIPILAERSRDKGRLVIHSADALQFDFNSLAVDSRPLRIVGNLPYNISTPLLFHLLESRRAIKDMHFMLQKEVVDRLVAKPGTKDYGRLSVMTQCHCHIEALFTVPPTAFEPPPKVDSAVVRLIPRSEPLVEAQDTELLHNVVMKAFSQRRKTLANTLKGLLSAEQISGQGIDPSRRAETLSIEEFVLLAQCLKHQ